MKKIIFLLCIVTSLANCQQKDDKKQDIHRPENALEGKKIDTFYTRILGEERPIWVHIPEGSDKTKKYPVLYLLDGNAHFESVKALMKHLVRFNQIPNMIVVGIPNTNRTLDLTPSRMAVSRNGDPIPKGINGGGEAFTSFLEKELIPYIEKTYPATSHKTFIGHSLGGLLVINTLIHHPEIFDNYIAIDPSLWWNNQKLLKETKTVLEQEQFNNKSLFVAVANTMRDGMTITKVEKDTSDATMHIRSILDFTKTTAKNTQNKLRFDWQYYEKENHGSVPLIAEYDGLKSVFSWYHFNINDEFRKPIATPEYLIDFIENHYAKASENFGYTVKPEEEFINQLGYRFLNPNPKSKAKSYAFFNLNIKNYPNSANVYDAMADYYEEQSDFGNALKNAIKAYELSNSDAHKNRIEKLEQLIE
ncbi:alpha/beta hydrolase [Spongiimicrobium salis]|uniref:alpha/beta hydrolase n=1 Tax=Spongiimicrobium salis TaxID=1667022 RepID=UPI00374CBCC5